MQNGFDFRKIPMGAFSPNHKKYHGHVVGGSIIGSIIGTAISTAINETVESYAGTVERARAEEQERARIRSEYNKKMANLPELRRAHLRENVLRVLRVETRLKRT